MKKFILGLLVGIVFATATAAYADEGLQKVEAYLRPTLPITLDGKTVKLENAPVVYDGSTYLKLRDVAALTGLKVNWNDTTQTVELQNSGGVTKMTDTTTPVQTTVAVAVKTVFNGYRAVEKNGITYFSPKDYEDKHFKDGKKDGKMVWKFDQNFTKLNIYGDNDQVKEVLDVKDESNILIYNGESYLNTKYYPGE